MSNVKDQHLSISNGIKNQIGKRIDNANADVRSVGTPRHMRKIAELLHRFPDSRLHTLGRGRAVFGNVAVDGIKFVARRRRETNPHTPCRLYSAAISSSVAISPRSTA